MYFIVALAGLTQMNPYLVSFVTIFRYRLTIKKCVCCVAHSLFALLAPAPLHLNSTHRHPHLVTDRAFCLDPD